jgi:hypothetical protein
MIVDDVPLLLLDDEADNASVNTKSPDDDPTAINRSIRQILNTFQKSSYVGYTATPFANIFILPDDPDPTYGEDLFPKGFIYYITPPSNYLGPARLFGFNEDLDGNDNTVPGLPLIKQSADDAVTFFPPAHNKRLVVQGLPDSLYEALQSFVITCAARRVRGQKDVHNSMLVHVTRFNDVQRQVMEMISQELINMRRMLEYGTGEQAKSFLDRLERIWFEDYLPIHDLVKQEAEDPLITSLKWEDVKSELFNAVTKIVVRGINGEAGDVLDYGSHPNGLNVIAVGGDKLSRGLTLDGLSVSYYVRPSRNYDTLLQMGRWFGYRPGYVDLCRLYTTSDLVSWYEHIAVANEELRREFNLMELSRLTPADYGLKVRTHPNGLNITAANKIRHGQRMRVSFSGHLSQTTVFAKTPEVHASNLTATEDLIKTLPPIVPDAKKKSYIWKNVAPKLVTDFLEGYEAHMLCRQAESDLLVKYIRKLNEFNELNNWTVALISSDLATAEPYEIAGLPIGLINRTDSALRTDLYMMAKSNILNPVDQHLDLSRDEFNEALSQHIAALAQRGKTPAKTPDKPSGPHIRAARPSERGLLLIYPLNHKHAFPEPFSDKPIIGFAISFPESAVADRSAIEYQVNTTFWRDRYGEEDEDDN